MEANAIVNVKPELQSPPRRMVHSDRLHNGSQIAPTSPKVTWQYFLHCLVVCRLRRHFFVFHSHFYPRSMACRMVFEQHNPPQY